MTGHLSLSIPPLPQLQGPVGAFADDRPRETFGRTERTQRPAITIRGGETVGRSRRQRDAEAIEGQAKSQTPRLQICLLARPTTKEGGVPQLARHRAMFRHF